MPGRTPPHALRFPGFFVVNLFLAVIFQEFIAAQAMEAANAEMTEREIAANAEAPARIDGSGAAAGRGGTAEAEVRYSYLGAPTAAPIAAPAVAQRGTHVRGCFVTTSPASE